VNSLGWRITGSTDPNATQEYPNSAALYFNKYYDTRYNYEGWLNTRPLREFRGHSYVKETDPNGGQTEHWFYQGDVGCVPTATGSNLTNYNNDPCFVQLRDREFLKGREYRTRTLGAAGIGSPVLQEQEQSFAVVFYDYTWAPLTGLWRAWSYQSQAIDRTWDGSASTSKTTRYAYETSYQAGGGQYGNLGRVEEYDQAGTLIRKTERYYNTRDDANTYLVDRVWQELVRDGSNRLLAITTYMYDGLTTSTGVGTRGLLTLVRKYYNVPLATGTQGVTLYSQDIRYAYDAYGNRTQETTYDGPGTRYYDGSTMTFSGPGNGSAARTTTTTYDPAFNAFPVQIDSPTVNGTILRETATYDYRMGTLTSVTDANGQRTSAEYDVFGRMVKLINAKPASQQPRAPRSSSMTGWGG
jgi:YD repeat-containing protein